MTAFGKKFRFTVMQLAECACCENVRDVPQDFIGVAYYDEWICSPETYLALKVALRALEEYPIEPEFRASMWEAQIHVSGYQPRDMILLRKRSTGEIGFIDLRPQEASS